MQQSGIIYLYQPITLAHRNRQKSSPATKLRSSGVLSRTNGFSRWLGIGLFAFALGGIVGPLTPMVRLESGYAFQQIDKVTKRQIDKVMGNEEKPLPKSVPVVFDPLVTQDGASIEPASLEFGLIIPKIGINTAVIPGVNPAKPGEYLAALEKGVAHASTSYFPDEDGTVYLFSHSTNYDWFVRDLNAVFYLLKNLEEGDIIVLFYKGKQYSYRLREKRIVAPNEVSYLVPQKGQKSLILQTCWPPGSLAQRLLIFADLIEEQNQVI